MAKRNDPRPWQEKRAVETARRRADAIGYELYRFEHQMSEKQRYILLARHAYYLESLAIMRYRPGFQESFENCLYEDRRRDAALAELRDPGFQRYLSEILQDPTVPREHIREIEELNDYMLERDLYFTFM